MGPSVAIRYGLAALLWAILLLGGCAAQPAMPTSPSAADDPRLPSLPLPEEVLTLPGDPDRPVRLEVTLFTPLGPGPFPLAVMNHGADQVSAGNRGERYRFTNSAYYFLSRGYAVALPMMRGFADSGGRLVNAGCELAAIARANARDIDAVIGQLARRPDIDTTRVVVAGQSFGGWNTLGVGASNPPPGVRGLVLFNPALRASDCPAQDEAMAAGAAALGADVRLPSLWFYGDNDTVMPAATWHAVFRRYTQAGAPAELVDVGSVGHDSHQFLGDLATLPLWTLRVDAFLARLGLPSAAVYPHYLAMPRPPATHFAAVADVAAVPYLDAAGRQAYQRFLAAAAPRAFAVAPGGAYGGFAGGYDTLGRALRNCGRMSGQCQLYAVDGEVVWTGAPPGADAAAPRLILRSVPANVAAPIGSFVDLNADCSVRSVPRVTIAVAPVHGSATVRAGPGHPHYPPGHPLAACNAVAVPMTAVVYTSAPDYAGVDAVTVEDLRPDGQRSLVRIELKVTAAVPE